ncbi:MAG: gliding motility-associated ABC transporter permease subunit GldF [Cyclobacteriaceae bacterium]
MLAVFQKEISLFLNSLIAYIVIGVFLTGIGLLTWIFPDTNVLDYGYASLDTLFDLGPYVLMFLIPAITMRTLAEERKTGTIELLLTRPLTDWDIVFGKFLASWVLVIFSILPTLIYYVSVYQLGNPTGNIDTPGIIGSYIGLILLGGLFAAIGMFASSLTDNQIVSFILAVFFCFIFFDGFEAIANIDVWGTLSLLISQIGIVYHYNTLSKGLLDLRDLIYFFSVMAFFLVSTFTIIRSRKW